MLRDPNINEFEVKVEKKNGRVYFTYGWSMLKNIYKVLAGGWMTIIFANRNLFLIRVNTSGIINRFMLDCLIMF